jgi:hypothetical protein
MNARVALLSLSFAALAGLARADVLTVDDDGPAQFTDLPAAVAAAAPGDVLLVAPGNYSGFTLDGVPLSVITTMHGDTLHVPWINGPIVVRNLQAGATVFFSGLRADPQGPPSLNPGHAVSVEQCAGSVRLADCVLRGFGMGSYLPGPKGWAGLHAQASHDVVLTGCKVTGSWGALADPACSVGGAAVLIEDASVTAWDCTLKGGYGGGIEYSPVVAADGGPGAQLVGGSLVVEGGSVAGGDGPYSDTNMTAGGIGIAADAQAIVRLRGAPVTGGTGGYWWIGDVPHQGPDGASLAVAGALEPLPGTPTLLSATVAAVEPGELFRIQSTGSGLLLAGLEGANAWLPGWSAPLHVDGGLLLPVASFPLTVTLPPLPPGFPGALLHLQLARSTHELSEPGLLQLELSLP